MSIIYAILVYGLGFSFVRTAEVALIWKLLAPVPFAALTYYFTFREQPRRSKFAHIQFPNNIYPLERDR